MSLETELQNIITKNLPKATGDALQARLKKADDDEYQLSIAKNHIIALGDDLKALHKQHDELVAAIGKHELIDERVKAVETRERMAEIATLNIKLDAEREKSGFMREVTMGLVRNVEYRNSIARTVTESNNTYDGSNGRSTGGGSTTSETNVNTQKAE